MAACLLNCRRNLSTITQQKEFSVFVCHVRGEVICWSHKTFLCSKRQMSLCEARNQRGWHRFKWTAFAAFNVWCDNSIASLQPLATSLSQVLLIRMLGKSTMLLTNRNWVLNWKTRCFLRFQLNMSFCCSTFQ